MAELLTPRHLRARPWDVGPEATACDLAALRFVGEQYATRLDVLAVVLGRLSPAAVRDAGRLGERTVRQRVERWEQAGWAVRRRMIGQTWILATRAGLRLAGLEFDCWEPAAARLAHHHAVAVVRLARESRPGAGSWVCERELWRRRGRASWHLAAAAAGAHSGPRGVPANARRRRSPAGARRSGPGSKGGAEPRRVALLPRRVRRGADPAGAPHLGATRPYPGPSASDAGPQAALDGRGVLLPARCLRRQGGVPPARGHLRHRPADPDRLALGRLLGGDAPVVLVWDNLAAHTSLAMRAWAADQHAWLTVEYLPAYAPDLNPVEGLWADLKGVELANRAC